MQCTVCKKELTGGLDTYGPIHEPTCKTCFFEFAPQSALDERIQNIDKKYRDELGVVRDCPDCKGLGVGQKRRCYKCLGTKQHVGEVCPSCAGEGEVTPTCWRCKGKLYLRGQICDRCDGTGEVEHECDCDRCTEDYDDCKTCNGRGIEYAPYNPQKSEVARPVRDYWLAPA